MKKDRCPLSVVKSCRSREQLYSAENYVKLWLRRHNMGRRSPASKLLFNAIVYQHVAVL